MPALHAAAHLAPAGAARTALATLAAWLSRRPRAAPEGGRRFGSYELLRPLASGGMGEIWLARHVTLSRSVAIKVVQPQLLARLAPRELQATLADFEQEARRTAALRSPHVVQLYDFGRTPEGTLYYAMELLGGLNLEQLVERFGPQPPGRVVALLRQVCSALAEAHGAGLIHRDIKGSNLQLTACGREYDFVKVLDFGLAVTSRGGRREVRERFITGTPAYLAPEAGARGAVVDARADLYSLGCVAYELLTGQLVFEAETDAEMVRAHLEHEPVPPSRRAQAIIPPELEQLVLELLRKEPGQRPPSAAAVDARLAALASRCAWSQEDAEAWWSARLPEELDRMGEDIESRIPTVLERRPAKQSVRPGRVTVPGRGPRSL